MCTNWKRFTFKAIILASLSLFLYGCGGGGATEAPAVKEFRGVVSDSTSGQPFANATVTAYAIDAAGNVATTPLSAAVQSDGQGNFVLQIPESYSGGIMLKASEGGTTVIRAVLPSVSQGQTVTISLATEMVVKYIEINKGGSFTADNIQKAILVLEPFFGPNFTHTAPPVVGTTPTPAQQQQLVVTQAINSLLAAGNTLSDLVTVTPGTGIIHLGEGAVFAALNTAIATANGNLINTGEIPGTSTPPVIIPVQEPNLTDVTPPTAPQNLTATATFNSVTLTWAAATDDVGVTAYFVYRNNIFVTAVAASTLTYTDNAVAAATSYVYEVKARDAAGNLSAGSTVPVTTAQLLTYSISGRITSNGSALPAVLVAVSGAGSGVVLTDAAGNYTFTGVRAGSYTVTPTLVGFAFTPENRGVDVTTANVSGVDFTAAAVIPGTVTGTTTYPDGTVVTTTTYPNGTVTTTTRYPNGTVTVSTRYPNGTVTITTTYPNGGPVTIGITYPDGTVTTSTTYPNGTITTSTTYPNGTVSTSTTYPNGTVTTSITYPNGAVTSSTTNPGATVEASLVYPP